MRARLTRWFLCFLLVIASGAISSWTQTGRGKARSAPAGQRSPSQAPRPAAKAPPVQPTKPVAITIITYPRDGGSVRHLDAVCHVRFSKSVARETFSFTVSPDVGGWRPDWSEDGQRVALEHVSPFTPGAQYSLTLKVAPPREPPIQKTVRFTAYGPASLDLIAQAEKAGAIDLDQAWTYRLQAILEPSALPAAFRSLTPTPSGTSVFRGLRKVRSQLKPETAEKLDRYLLRPTDPRSIFAARVGAARQQGSLPPSFASSLLFAQERPTKSPAPHGWFGVDSRLYPITVWSPKSAQAADVVVAAIESKSIYGRFKGLMPFEPESDADVQPDNGGDGRLDIYVIPRGPDLQVENGMALGLTVGLTENPITPCFILIRDDQTGARLVAVLAHELFHAFQFAIDGTEPDWWSESTATWAENFIDARSNLEQDYLEDAFEKPPHRLQTLTSGEGLHAYGAYIFPLYLSSSRGDKMIGDLWTDCAASGPNALDAVKSRLGQTGSSGFSDAFKEFALMNYNDLDPFGPTYSEELNVFPHHGEHKVKLEKDHGGVAFDLPPLSAVYIDVYNYGIDKQKTPSVTFDLDAFKDLPEVQVQGVVMHGQKEEVQDWTGLDEKLFCLNVPDQEFERIVVVVSSTETEKTHQALDLPMLLARDPRCDADWIGTLTFTRSHSQSHSDPGEPRKTGKYQPQTGADWVDQFTTHGVEESCRISVNAVVQMALKSAGKGDDEMAELNREFAKLGGPVVYTQDALDGSCTINYEHKLVESTKIEPSAKPGEFILTSIQRASSGSRLIPVGLTLLRAPRLSVDSKNGKYTLEVNFTFAQCRGESIVESNKGDRTVNPWDVENRQALFDSYPLRTQWNEPALQGTFQGDSITGEWSPPAKPSPGEGVPCSLFDLRGAKVKWELHRVKR